ncbi:MULTISPECIES: hypothetical protein [unclassified Duganella]|uniref:hypothetical protein n=1 Tax=unclassified Duganella TaxID=2636909 RepID=UPI0012E3D1F9|nr:MULTISPECIES: hypothetical protein [unclassified Duganella]
MRYLCSLLSCLLTANLTACAAESGPQHLWQSATSLVLQCPPGQDCAGTVDYRALYIDENGRQVYLSFDGDLPLSAPNAAAMAKAFHYGDLYWPEGQGMAAAHLQADGGGDGRLRFLPAQPGRLRAEAVLTRYRVVVERSGGEECRLDDVAGICHSETVVKKPLRILLDFPLPAAAGQAPARQPGI